MLHVALQPLPRPSSLPLQPLPRPSSLLLPTVPLRSSSLRSPSRFFPSPLVRFLAELRLASLPLLSQRQQPSSLQWQLSALLLRSSSPLLSLPSRSCSSVHFPTALPSSSRLSQHRPPSPLPLAPTARPSSSRSSRFCWLSSLPSPLLECHDGLPPRLPIGSKLSPYLA